jgi:hypothetical protein
VGKQIVGDFMTKKWKVECGGTCLLSQLLGKQRWGGLWFEADLGKKLVRLSLSRSTLGMVVHIYNPSTWEAEERGS